MNRHCRIGIHGRNGINFYEADYKTILEAKIETVKMVSYTRVDHFKHLKEMRPDIELITRLFDDRFGPDSRPSPQQFARRMAPLMRQLQPFCTKFEIHNEPNHMDRIEGWGDSDADAQNFNTWFLRTAATLKSQCPWAQLGFPGLAIPHRDLEWLEQCRPAVEQADWLGVHCYWQTPATELHNHLSDFWGLRFKYYHQKFPNKVIELTEVGNANIQNGLPVSEADYAKEAAEYYAECFRYPYLNSASFFILSSPAREWDDFTWRGEDERLHNVVWTVRDMQRPFLKQAESQAAQPAPAPTPASTQEAQVQQLQAQNVQLQAQIQQLQAQTTQLNAQTKQLETNLVAATTASQRATTHPARAQLQAAAPAAAPRQIRVTAPPIQNLTKQLANNPSVQVPLRALDQIDRIVVHHTGTPLSVTANRIAGFMVKRGHTGISYHHFITGDGLIQQTNELYAITAHTANPQLNQVSLGLGFAGNFNRVPPTPAQIESGARLIAWLIRQLNLSPQAVFGLKEIVSSQSPGAQWDSGAMWGAQLRQKIHTQLTGN